MHHMLFNIQFQGVNIGQYILITRNPILIIFSYVIHTYILQHHGCILVQDVLSGQIVKKIVSTNNPNLHKIPLYLQTSKSTILIVQ